MKKRKLYFLLLLSAFFPFSSLFAQTVSPDGSVPVVFHSTESINPGETISLQGSSFGADPQVWFALVKGTEKDLKPQSQLTVLTHSESYAAAQIP
ncbi:MAG: hypothetical protein PHS30_03165, partial [Bacteroidales bacterium]|nr:hypothetical protein [Bacteroidales bacterium]